MDLLMKTVLQQPRNFCLGYHLILLRQYFDFLGFTHYMSKSRRGKNILKRKTSSKKLKLSLNKIYDWIKVNRHLPIKELINEMNRKLRGYYEYYRITFNSRSLRKYYEQIKRMLYKWINRRGGNRLQWERYSNIVMNWLPLLCRKYITAII